MTHIYIHIGLHKTGTSSIQTVFFENRDDLLGKGINYLDLGRNHSGPLCSLLSEHPERYFTNVRHGIDTVEKAARYNREVGQRLEACLRGNRSPKLVISAEDLTFLPPESAVALREKLAPHATRLSVIAYVRDPISAATSIANQSVSAGKRLATCEAEPPGPRYRKRLGPFIDAFGRDAVDIRIFGAEHFAGGTLISDFLTALGEPPGLLDHVGELRMNRSLSYEATLILDQVNELAPMFRDGKANPDRAPALKGLLEQVAGTPFVLRAAPDAETKRRFEEDLDWLHGILGRKVFTLRDFPAGSPEWPEETIRSLARLLNELALKNARLSARRLVYKARLIARDDREKARDLLLRELQRHRTSPDVHYELSRLHHDLGDEQEARIAAQTAAELAPDNKRFRRWAAQFD